MQLKIVTPIGNFRFNAKGEQIPAVTEEFVQIEVSNRESVERLYDQNAEHLMGAFNYSANGEIIELSSTNVQNAIQDFMLNPGAWYFENPRKPDQDTSDTQAPAVIPSRSPVGVPSLIDSAQAVGSSFWTPTPDQQLLLRKIAGATDLQFRLQTKPNQSWAANIQQLLLVQQKYGIEDVQLGQQQAQAELDQLIAEATAQQIPDLVVETTLTTKRAEFEVLHDDPTP